MLLQMVLFYNYLQLSNILLCVSLSIHCRYLFIVFIYSSVYRHLGCFHVLAIVNSAAMNIRVHVPFQMRVFIFSRYTSRSGIAGSHGSSIFIFEGTSILFSIVATPIYIPTNSV